jgi:rubrerythrin
MALHKKINDKLCEFKKDKELFQEYSKERDDIRDQLENEMTYAARCASKERLRVLEAKLDSITDEKGEIEFLLDLVPIARKCDDEGSSPAASGTSETGGILGFVKRESGQLKGTLLKEYIQDVEKHMVRAERIDDQSDYLCKECGATLLIFEAEASAVCPQCGMTTWAWDIYNNNLTYDEEISRDHTSYYAYKRINHFSEWLASVQAKENTKIPDEVLDALRVEYKKIRVSRASQITPSKTKEFLKKLKLTKYYEHVHYITNLLNGITPMWIPPNLEEKMKQMFQEIQTPWQKTKPKNRSNFFSYSYVLHKFCELLGADEYLPLFPLLKSAEKLYQQDQMWKSVCAELGWEFRSSV